MTMKRAAWASSSSSLSGSESESDASKKAKVEKAPKAPAPVDNPKAVADDTPACKDMDTTSDLPAPALVSEGKAATSAKDGCEVKTSDAADKKKKDEEKSGDVKKKQHEKKSGDAKKKQHEEKGDADMKELHEKKGGDAKKKQQEEKGDVDMKELPVKKGGDGKKRKSGDKGDRKKKTPKPDSSSSEEGEEDEDSDEGSDEDSDEDSSDDESDSGSEDSSSEDDGSASEDETSEDDSSSESSSKEESDAAEEAVQPAGRQDMPPFILEKATRSTPRRRWRVVRPGKLWVSNEQRRTVSGATIKKSPGFIGTDAVTVGVLVDDADEDVSDESGNPQFQRFFVMSNLDLQSGASKEVSQIHV